MVGVSDAQQVTDNQAESRFELWADGLLAELPYRRNGKRLVLIHTEVPEELEGRGLGGALVTAAIDRAVAGGAAIAGGGVYRRPRAATPIATEASSVYTRKVIDSWKYSSTPVASWDR
jgi:predicted GNAT family acetyltransferase